MFLQPVHDATGEAGANVALSCHTTVKGSQTAASEACLQGSCSEKAQTHDTQLLLLQEASLVRVAVVT
jgi:hypothetical protein